MHFNTFVTHFSVFWVLWQNNSRCCSIKETQWGANQILSCQILWKWIQFLVELSRDDDNFISWGKDQNGLKDPKVGGEILLHVPCSFVLAYSVGAQIFQESRSRLKILGATSLHEASSVPRTPKYYHHRTKFRRHGDLPHGICTLLAWRASRSQYSRQPKSTYWRDSIWNNHLSYENVALYLSSYFSDWLKQLAWTRHITKTDGWVEVRLHTCVVSGIHRDMNEIFVLLGR